MQEQYWVITQMAIDMCMLALLVVLLKMMSRKRGTRGESDPAFLQSEELLKEMRHISEQLEKNLEEKRTLSRNITTELETLLCDAQQATLRLEGLMDSWNRSRSLGKNAPPDTERLKKSAKVLLEQGLAKKEIAKRLDVPLGELDLMLKLQSPVPGKGS